MTHRAFRPRRRARDDGPVTDEELVVEVALTRLDHPALDLEEIAALVVRRIGTDAMLDLAGRALAARDGLRGTAFATAVEQVVRVVLTARDGEG